MKTIQSIFIAIITFAACTKPAAVAVSQPIQTMPDTTFKGNPGTYTYLALGDSYTIGQSVIQSESFPYQLATALTAVTDTVNAPTIIATTGWTTQNLIDAIASSGIHAKTYDFVTLLIGVNDQYQGLSQTTYANNFTTLLNEAITFAKGDTSRVFVLSIPDYGVTPFAEGEDHVIGPEIDAFNAINLQITNQFHVHYLNITDISREAATEPDLIAPDGLHPSGKMYGMWIMRLAPMVEARLKQK